MNEDGVAIGGCFEASERAITIRNTEKKAMSQKQLGNLNPNLDDDDDDICEQIVNE